MDYWVERDPTHRVLRLTVRSAVVTLQCAEDVVGPEPSIYGLARIFHMCREFLGDKFQVVGTLGEAYDFAGAHPEDFTEHLYPKDLAA